MKKIYIVLTNTGTILSKIIKFYTKDEFTHVSIALDSNLQEMYSFGRLNPYNPFIGGFLHEYINKGTFKRFYKTISRIYVLDVEDEQYEKIKNIIIKFSINKYIFKFNTIGLFAIAFKKKIKKDKAFYCAEFVKYVLDESNIKLNLPELIRPESFKGIDESMEIYSGLLKDYTIDKIL